MRKITLFMLGMGAVVFVRGQSISPEVRASAGGQGTVATTTIDWTIGEPLVETIAGGSEEITQGFHQPRYTLVGLEDLKPLGLEVSVFPNPAQDDLYFEFARENDSPLQVELIDLNGRTLQVQNSDLKTERLKFDLSELSDGQYFLRLRLEGDREIRAYKVQKIQ